MPIQTVENKTLTIGTDDSRVQLIPGRKIFVAGEELVVESIYSCVSLVTEKAFHFALLSDKSYLFYPDQLDSNNCIRLSKFAFYALSQTINKISENDPSEIESADNFALFINHRN